MSFIQVCIGWTLAFVLVVGSILILTHCGPDLPEPVAVERREEVE